MTGITVLVTGSRNFTDYSKFKEELSKITDIKLMIFGDCRGADAMAKNYCKEYGIKYNIYKANWSKFGLSAGPRRNMEMIDKEKPDLVVGFLTKTSKGTKQCIDCATYRKIEKKIIYIL